jgi:CRP/FNR family cyclic AMP-dependent transcriptional regulator
MKKILIIEDSEDIRENTAEILELAHYQVDTAADGKEGVAKAIDFRPDLIVCDIMMPVLDGYAVLHMVRKHPGLQHVPFIFLTAKAERTDMRKGMELGADDYITKPFNGTELLNAIEGRLKKTELLTQSVASGINGFDALVEIATDKRSLEDLAEGRSVNKYKKKQVIYSEGNFPSRLFYITKGRVKTYKMNDDGKELVIGLYDEGDFLGHIALLEGTAYKEWAEALTDCELAIIPKDEFDALINNNPQIAQKLIRLLAKNVTEHEQQLLHLAYSSLRKKVAEALVALYRKYHRNEGTFSIDLSRENLAALAGTAKESMIRTLGDFKDEQIIDIRDGAIVILNLQKLEKMIN